MILASALQEQGLEVQEAENGEAVLNLFRAEEFETDLVLMDVQMPVMDGITATEKLRQELGVKTPIIGITADATSDTERDGLRAGMNQVLFKPLDVPQLLQSILTRKWV